MPAEPTLVMRKELLLMYHLWSLMYTLTAVQTVAVEERAGRALNW